LRRDRTLFLLVFVSERMPGPEPRDLEEMTEAYVLAGELNRAGADYREAFRRHEQRLRPFIERKGEWARNFAGAFTPKTRLGVWIRNQVTRLLAIPPIAHFLIGRDLVDDFDLPNYQM
jgi:2-polyprenyl-6-methoxyphenol hydroxylase-like FAD-dependent oxidoreductase